MKGTLFSADFIKDNSGNLRLLELNTDTALVDAAINQLDYSGIESIINESSIDEVHLIYKSFHENFVNELSTRLQSNTSSSVHLIREDESSIYPTSVEDAENKFILRMAYDESAIFDSTYCKNPIHPLSLFTSSSFGQYVAEYYVSSSEYHYNGLNLTLNPTNIPDVVVKSASNIASQPNTFYKIGQSSLDLGTRWSTFTSSFDSDDLIINFYNDVNDSKVKSYRSFNIIYGSNLDILNLGDFEIEGLFEKPTSVSYDDNNIKNTFDIKHYYELTTTYPRFSSWGSWNGIFEEEQILKSDNTSVTISSASIGDSFKSYFISGSPNTDVPYEFMQWSHSGNSLPSGSYLTSSILIDNLEQPLSFGTIVKTTVGGTDSFRASGASHVLIYDSGSDVIRYEEISKLETGSQYMFDLSGSIVPITDVTFEILDGEYSQYVIDMESTDTFFINTGLGIKIVTHNCFPAGTEITLADGTVKLIEELTTEDVLLTYNENTKEYSSGSIGDIQKKKERLLIHLVTAKGDIKSTPFHRFFVKGKGWVKCQDILVGDILIHEEGVEVLVTDRNDLVGDFEVYHILDVKNDHTYFANGLLVHNLKIVQTCFSAGTRITLSNHEEKFIEDVVIGDSVFGWDGEKLVPGKVIAIDSSHKVGDHAERCKALGHEPSLYTIDDTGIEFTPEHPFLTKDGWKSLSPDPNQEPFKTEQEPKVLEVGDEININGEWTPIQEIRVVRSNPEEKVYNITVDGVHSYLAEGIIVHNK